MRLSARFVARATYDGVFLSTIAAIIIVVLAMLAPGLDDTTRLVYSIAGATVVPSTMVVLYTNLAGAIRMFGWCYVPDGVVRPSIFLICVVAMYVILPAGRRGDGDDRVRAAVHGGVAVSVFLAVRPHLPPLSWPVRSDAGWRRAGARKPVRWCFCRFTRTPSPM